MTYSSIDQEKAHCSTELLDKNAVIRQKCSCRISVAGLSKTSLSIVQGETGRHNKKCSIETWPSSI